MKFVIFTALFVLSIATVESLAVDNPGGNIDCTKRCPFQYLCNPEADDDIVYTIENGKCKLYKTPCFYESMNCLRLNKCLPKIESVTKEQCMQLCPQPCGPAQTPNPQMICANFHNGATITQIWFNSLCELENYVCTNKRPFTSYYTGMCI